MGGVHGVEQSAGGDGDALAVAVSDDGRDIAAGFVASPVVRGPEFGVGGEIAQGFGWFVEAHAALGGHGG